MYPPVRCLYCLTLEVGKRINTRGHDLVKPVRKLLRGVATAADTKSAVSVCNAD